ncbi:hypothetical protein Pmar_PMAR020172 [Perkinsus marinus ATCC 50983]|uniref:C3H1-type domain-containing protein n=1 Tax=Perkinsus marinus (strain ATCC 50983 / TXsc) TaxID=423536 RepID=C5LPU7_PERM5|nr:hypothetical protein Pmar_PMAR020172 [Perkinsus marinus ATCC 50983]EER01265.1 hypothetical protein Pmar_PMAR020172 [Perkinsus marinus ATCC 50983]|eukprot:XP_002768547.1 hypothetical protein Pmar_PMAR020172 [Perkinsus marinus ATCC 50983]
MTHYLSFCALPPKDSSTKTNGQKLFNFNVSKAEKGQNPFFGTQQEYALLVAAVVNPDDLSALDVASYLLRLLSLNGALPVEELVLYYDKYRRSVASLVASSRSMRDCFVGDAYPTLLAEFSFNRSRMAPRDSSNNLLNKQGSKFGICYAFRDGKCGFGNNCRFRHSSGPRKVSGESTAEAKPSGETQRKVAGKEDEKASSGKSG